MRIRPIFAWYDLWVGVFIDRPKRQVYIFPLPCIGFAISLVPIADGQSVTEVNPDGDQAPNLPVVAERGVQ